MDYLETDPDIDAKRIAGEVVLEFGRDIAGTLDLDTKGLEIQSVQVPGLGPIPWELEEPDAIKGSRNEIRAIKAWLVARARMKAPGRSFFLSEQRKPLHGSTVNLLLRKYGEKARLPVAVHPQMLHHACGFALADQGADTRLIQDYLGHRNIQHTVGHTATNPARFEKLWR
jgi:site-specific recombinase XerC